VLTAFIATAYITWFCCIAKSRIDHLRAPVKRTPNLDKWSFALGTVILSFSDQQIVTGISVIVAGASQLSSGLDSYHWQTVANLAWFSTFTHVTTLAALRGEDRFNKTIRKLRIVGMAVLVTMIICISYSLGWTSGTVANDETYQGASLPASFPALCLYRPGIPWGYSTADSGSGDLSIVMVVTYNWPYTALTVAILLLGFLSRVLLLYFDSTSEAMDKIFILLRLDKLLGWIQRLGVPHIKSLESRLESLSRRSMWYRLCRCTYALKHSAKQMYSSTVWEVCISV
jgi:hypothetical protein